LQNLVENANLQSENAIRHLITLPKEIERNDLKALMAYMSFLHKRSQSKFPQDVGVDKLKKIVANDRNAKGYDILISQANFFGLYRFKSIIQQTKEDLGFYTPPVEETKLSMKRSVLGKNDLHLYILGNAREVVAPAQRRPCKECKSSCENHECTLCGKSTVVMNRALQQKEYEKTNIVDEVRIPGITSPDNSFSMIGKTDDEKEITEYN